MTERAVRAFTEAVCRSMEENEQELLVFVTHGGVIMSILSELGRPARDYYDFQTPNLSGWLADCRLQNGDLSLLKPEKIREPGAAGSVS